MKWLITGGCGFIGYHATEKLLEQGHHVAVVDNLSRAGSGYNLECLKRLNGDLSHFDDSIISSDTMDAILKHVQPDVVLHLAAQVAVTTSIDKPLHDFYTNACGTFYVLEAIRVHSPHSIFINASTNKVYGDLNDCGIFEDSRRYRIRNEFKKAIDETQQLDFHSPYGCSKGVADQYTIDYARIYDLKTVTLRQSCIYGTQQFGVEDQGWVAWMMIANMLKKQLTVYGTGKQVRDILYVDDLVDCYQKCVENIDSASGKAFNIGGGIDNSISVLELFDRTGIKLGSYKFGAERKGDQKIYVSDVQKAKNLLGWEPKTDVEEGLSNLNEWLHENKNKIDSILNK